MLFNSYAFIFIFLPCALGGFALASRFGTKAACAWLALCSLAFYGYWNPALLGVLLGSIALNLTCGHLIDRHQEDAKRQNLILATGVVLNIAVLGVFKYLEPVLRELHRHALISTDMDLKIVLPLGLSFFTFTQIGYLVDRRDGVGRDFDLVRYTAFVTFFPHLIAGPILRARDMGPQLADPKTLRITGQGLAVGLTIFALGLAKKVLLADPLAGVAKTGFDNPEALGAALSWIVALTYSAQLYFDFSGYSDMAIGLAAMFGIRFPLNFNSPYKARSVIDYWQRWHITLSRYLNLLIYNPIALRVTRRRAARGLGAGPKDRRTPGAFMSLIVLPTFVTMGLAGVWHGAGLQFLIFGLLHAFYLAVNHAWRIYGPKASKAERPWAQRTAVAFSQAALTYLAVLVGSVFFRAESAGKAMDLLAGMAGARGLGLPPSAAGLLNKLGPLGQNLLDGGAIFGPADLVDPLFGLRLLVSFAIIWSLPNVQQIIGKASPALTPPHEPAPGWMTWRPSALWAVGIGLLLLVNFLMLRQPTVFLYFQF